MAFATWEFQFNASTSPPPTGAQVRLDNADQTLATHLMVMHSTNDGADISLMIAEVGAGDFIRLRDFDDATRWQTYEVAARADQGTWSDFTVTWHDGGTPLAAQKIALTAYSPDEPGIPPGGVPGQILGKVGPADFDVGWVDVGEGPTPPVATNCEAWPIVWACETTGVEPALLDGVQALAQSLLWALSGRRLGVCTHHEGYWPPCSSACGVPYKDSTGAWRNGGGRGGDCCRMLLDHRPIWDVTAVEEFGVALEPGEWSWSGSYLRRVGVCWPCSDRCADPPVIVTYAAGVPLPVGTDLAMGEVACEVLAGVQGKACRLPSRATQVTRQGVTVQLADPAGVIESGRVGLPIADAWLTVVNKTGLDRPSAVFSPDLARRS